MFAAAAMSLSSLFVVTNALRLRLFTPAGAEPLPPEETNANPTPGELSSPGSEPIEKGEIPMEKIMTIEGMSCAHCSARVEKALNAIRGVSALVDLDKKTATVTMDAPVADETLSQAVEDAGYEVVNIR